MSLNVNKTVNSFRIDRLHTPAVEPSTELVAIPSFILIADSTVGIASSLLLLAFLGFLPVAS